MTFVLKHKVHRDYVVTLQVFVDEFLDSKTPYKWRNATS